MREQAVGLEHHAHVALVRGHPADVLATDGDRARRGLVEAGEDPQRGGLAAARRAEQGDQFAGFDVQGEPVERLTVPYTRVRSVRSTATPLVIRLLPLCLMGRCSHVRTPAPAGHQRQNEQQYETEEQHGK